VVLSAGACALALVVIGTVPALAHVPAVESGAHDDAHAGEAAATPMGGPEKSRAVYGYVEDGEPDRYAFTTSEPVVRTVGLIVPAYEEHADFRPTLALEADGVEVAHVDDPGLSAREREFEPFSLTWFWAGAEDEFQFEPGIEYTLVVEPGVGDDSTGRYVVVVGGPEEFTAADWGATLVSLPRIWLGQYGSAPYRWNWLALIPAAFTAAAIVALAWFVASAWRTRRERSSGGA
jgi:hypothetical protein